ncbi:MAG TPA: HAMP domain-containing sensor histidine kinase [Polyangiaceae bacterium]|jgi:signal transduction histidine kinase|nr:HAMP domain-containing sensor histidine kinase [Polyangiaceae bacterium]
MASSFRRRLLSIAALTTLVCAAAITAILLLARATAVERVDRARDNVRREVEGLRGVLEAVPPSQRPRRDHASGELQSGFVAEPAAPDKGPALTAALDEALARAASTRSTAVLDRADDTTPVLVAASPVPGGGYVFALQRVVAGRETRGLRAVVLALSLLSFALVLAALRTLTAVERGVSMLRGSLELLAKDLRAPVARPPLRELDEVASGIDALAKDLGRAQTERERLTRELAERDRLAALGRVAAGIAHEVRNPLAAMKLRADLARASGEASPAVARDLEDIASEIGRLDRLVSDLLVVAGRRAGPRTEVDVGQLVEKRAALLSPWAAERGVEVSAEGASVARVDADAIARAVDNMLRNGVEASPSGTRVDARVSGAEGRVRIEVSDHGPGVPADRAAELFEPFFTTKPDGTGLGLALARAVAAAHGGDLTYAREGGVTRFVLELG